MKTKTIFLLSLILLTACGPTAEELVVTYAAQTEVAEVTRQVLVQQSINATFTYEASLATATPLPTSTPTATATFTPTFTPTPIPVAEVIVETTSIREGPGENYSIVQEATQGETFEIIGQNEEGTWLAIQVGAGVRGWIPAEDVQISVTGLTFELVNTPVPPLSKVYITFYNGSTKEYFVEIPPSGRIRVPAAQSYTFTLTPGQYQILIYSRPTTSNKCQTTA
ncbi:SH3 domain-containing protein, partial [Chloroflexota bacterium]